MADVQPFEPACQKPISCAGGADATRRAVIFICVTKKQGVGLSARRPDGTALRRQFSASQQHFRRPVGMVPNHVVACVEGLIQAHPFDQAIRYRDVEHGEFVRQRADNTPVEGRLMQAVVENAVLAREPAILVAQHLQEHLA